MDHRSALAKANSIEQGLTRTHTGPSYRYVDINHDGNYDALVDIIVDLNRNPHPGPGHFVYLEDLAGNPRVRFFMDRGAYEWYRPPSGSIVAVY